MLSRSWSPSRVVVALLRAAAALFAVVFFLAGIVPLCAPRLRGALRGALRRAPLHRGLLRSALLCRLLLCNPASALPRRGLLPRLAPRPGLSRWCPRWWIDGGGELVVGLVDARTAEDRLPVAHDRPG